MALTVIPNFGRFNKIIMEIIGHLDEDKEIDKKLEKLLLIVCDEICNCFEYHVSNPFSVRSRHIWSGKQLKIRNKYVLVHSPFASGHTVSRSVYSERI